VSFETEKKLYKESARNHAQRLSELQFLNDYLVDDLTEDEKEGLSSKKNPLVLFGKMIVLRKILGRPISILDSQSLTKASACVLSYSRSVQAATSMKRLVDAASSYTNKTGVVPLEDPVFEADIWNDVVDIFGTRASYDSFFKDFKAGISMGKSDVLNILSGEFKLSQYNRSSASAMVGEELIGDHRLRLPTSVEGVHVDYIYAGEETQPQIGLVVTPLM